MKVIYEFDEREDRNERNLFENSKKMYEALTEIENYLRVIRRGYMEESIENIIENISEQIDDSRIREIE